MIGIALAFLVIFIFLPLVMAPLRRLKRSEGYLGAISEPDALSAIYLTLLTAAIAVPLNLIFGIAACGQLPSSIL